VWPVHGSVLALDGALYFAAGKSSYLDDGLYFYKLDARTGEKLVEKRIYSRDPVTGDQVSNAGHDLPGGLNDILATDGETLFMRDFQFHLDTVPEEPTIKGVLPENMKPHVHNTAGYLDDTWAHRTYWYYGTKMRSGYGGWASAGKSSFSGRLMVRDEHHVFGYGRKALENDFGSAPALGYYARRDTHLYAGAISVPEDATANKGGKGKAAAKLAYTWSSDCDLHVRAMALADDKVLVAGTSDILSSDSMTRERIAQQASLLEGDSEQYFRIHSKQDGRQLAEYRLAAKPVFDGMAVAHGCVFIATEANELVCYAPRR
jgi:hypothetical protein